MKQEQVISLSLMAFISAPTMALEIYEIQGASHASPYANQSASTQGVVTALQSNGFYLQHPTGDGNLATSDGIFVFTGASRLNTLVSNGLAVAKSVTINNGPVKEFLPGGVATNLTFTEFDLASGPSITSLVSIGAATTPITPSILGIGGRPAPTSTISNGPINGTFSPSTEGIDFYESIEGMLVTLPNAKAVSSRNQFNEVFAVANGGVQATGMNARGGITVSAGDFNPERLQIDDTIASVPPVSMGQSLGNVTGVISYNFANYELLTKSAVTPSGSLPAKETTSLAPTQDRLTIASFNVLNLHPNAGADKFSALSNQIVNNLNSPDIIALQEIQDNNGATNNGVTDASLTYQTLINAVSAQGGPTYQFADVAPVNNADGGEPGGNIRPGYLYNPDRVDLVGGAVQRLPGSGSDAAFIDSRKPLLAEFSFNGESLTIINNHLKSKGEDEPLFGASQPPIEVTAAQRIAQAEFINTFVDSQLASNPNAKFVVLGDLNDFGFSDTLQALEGGTEEKILFNLADQLDPSDRYTYNFDGNSQQLDHILVSAMLIGENTPLFDIVHLNTGLSGAPSDHDPLLASFQIPSAVVPVPAALPLFLSGLAFLFGPKFRRRFF